MVHGLWGAKQDTGGFPFELVTPLLKQKHLVLKPLVVFLSAQHFCKCKVLSPVTAG